MEGEEPRQYENQCISRAWLEKIHYPLDRMREPLLSRRVDDLYYVGNITEPECEAVAAHFGSALFEPFATSKVAARVFGVIHDESGRPVSTAEVSLAVGYDVGSSVIFETSLIGSSFKVDSDGRFHAAQRRPAAVYQITIAKKGYRSSSFGFRNRQLCIEFVLSPAKSKF